MEVGSPEDRRERLKVVYAEASGCVRCALAQTRTTVVFGSGHADAGLMFVGEAPGAQEDKTGLPFVGQAGKLLDRLLGEIRLERSEVFVANVVKCLRYNVPVQLGDGSWERIGRLVRTGYAGSVMSVDATGRLVPRRVTGWHATPVGARTVHRLTYRAAKRSGAGRVGIELTGDHPVLTERGFVAAEDLREGDRIATGQGLSALAHDVVCGTLLGDGSLSQQSAHLTMGHSKRQRGYATFKARILAELHPRIADLEVAAVAGDPRSYPVVHVRTLAHRSLAILRREFYDGRKRVPSWLAQGLSDLMLAIWFMDDGHMRIRPGRQALAEIATVGFSDGDRQILQRGLLRLGLPASAARGRLYFDAPATRALAELIAPFVPQPMRYKLPADVAARVPFEPARLQPGPPEVLFDEVEVQDITDRRRTDVTFFCIDVEETHNFVTSGGVVHNCRPPQNRDPHPHEIEACRDYLVRQVELIQPRVVCSLGNFATKLLRGDPAGITRVHGRPEVRSLGERGFRLFPLFHPAAALYTPAMLDVLRADFERIPALLELEPPPAPEAVPEPALDEAATGAPPRAATGGAAGGAATAEVPDPAEEQERPPQLGLF